MLVAVVGVMLVVVLGGGGDMMWCERERGGDVAGGFDMVSDQRDR